MHPVAVYGERMDKYVEHVNKYDFSSLRFHVPLSSIASFTKANNLSINVYVIEDDKKVIYPLCVSEAVVPGRHLDLLLYESNSIQHYTTIKNFSRLVSSQLSKHLLLQEMSTRLHDSRTVRCSCRGLLSRARNRVPQGYMVYADFESILKPVNEDERKV